MSEFTEAELLEAKQLSDQIEGLAVEIRSTEKLSASNWVRLGSLVHKVRQKKYWDTFGFRSFGSYVASLEPKINRKRSQVYLCVGVVETLGAQIPEDTMVQIGITKANELRKYVKETGKLVPEELIAAALDTANGIDAVRAEVSEALHRSPEEKGSWYDFGGFFATEEEKTLIEDTIELAKAVDPVIPHDWPEHMIRKEIMMRFIAEFHSTYAAGAE